MFTPGDNGSSAHLYKLKKKVVRCGSMLSMSSFIQIFFFACSTYMLKRIYSYVKTSARVPSNELISDWIIYTLAAFS